MAICGVLTHTVAWWDITQSVGDVCRRCGVLVGMWLQTCVSIPLSARADSAHAYCCDCGFASRRWHWCLSLVCVMCRQIQFPAMGWSLVQRSPTECGLSECDTAAMIPRRPCLSGGCWAIKIWILTLSLLMSYIYGAPCKFRNFNVVYIWTYVWQRWKPSFSICCTMFQHWINTKSFPVSQLCVNTLPAAKITLITNGI
jgi:hypothetical protein